MTLFKKAMRTILEYKTRYIGSMLLFLISSMMFITMNLTFMSLDNMFQKFPEQNVSSDAGFLIDADIDAAALGRQFAVKAGSGGTAGCEVKSGQALRVFSAMNGVNIPAVQKGKLPDNSEILLDRPFAQANGYQIRNKITVADKEFTISGYVLLPNYIYVIQSKEEVMNNPSAFDVAVVGREDFEALPGKNRVYATRFNSKGNIKAQEASIKNALRSQGIQIINQQSTSRKVNVSYIPMEIDMLSAMNAAIPLTMLALTCVLFGMLMWHTIRSESVIIGTSYTRGYRRDQFHRHYLTFPLPISVIGSVMGSIVRLLLVDDEIHFMLSAFSMLVQKAILNPWLAVFAAALLIIILCGIIWCIIDRTLKTAPAVLMKGGEAKNRANFLERGLRLNRFGFSTRFKVREQVRSLSKTFFLLFGVVVVTVLTPYGLAMKSSVDYMLCEGISKLYDFKCEYVFTSAKTRVPPAGTEQFNAAYVNLADNEDVSFYVTKLLSDTKMVRLRDTFGQSFQPDQTTITATLAQKLNVKVGDSVMVFNTENGEKHMFTIEKIAGTYTGDFLFLPFDRLNAGFGYPDNAYLGIWSGNAMAFVQGEIQSTKSIDTIAAGPSKMIDQMGPMIYGLIASAFLLGPITLYTITGLVVDESRASISPMKVFGYREEEIGRLVLNSNTLIIILGYLLGVPALLGTTGVFFGSLTEDLQVIPPVKLNAVCMLFGFVIVTATYEFAKWMYRKEVAHTSMSEALKAGTE